MGLALAVGGLTISSITSSVGGGGGGGGPAGKAAEPAKQLLDRVPQPLPVTKRAEQAVTQVTSKGEKCSQVWANVAASFAHQRYQQGAALDI